MTTNIEKIILELILRHKLEPVKARAYLESIAEQLANKLGDNDIKSIRPYIVKATQIAPSYDNPTTVLRILDFATENYLQQCSQFDLFNMVTLSTSVRPRTLDDLEFEGNSLIEGEKKNG